MVLLKVTTAKNVWFGIMGFFNHGFEIPDSVCNGCHDLTMLIVNKNNIVIMSIKNVDYCCIIHNIVKSEAINLF